MIYIEILLATQALEHLVYFCFKMFTLRFISGKMSNEFGNSTMKVGSKVCKFGRRKVKVAILHLVRTSCTWA